MDSLIKRLKDNNIRSYDFKDLHVDEYVGEGGFSSVYKCFIDGKLYAVNRLYFEFDDSFEQFKKDLFKELMLSKIMTSKRFTKVFGFSYDYDEEEFYIIMEYLNNGDFHSYMSKCCFSYQEKLKIFNSLVHAVKSLHDIDYIHCDLKMDNFSYHMDYQNNKKYMKLFDYNCMVKGKSNSNHMVKGDLITKGYSSPESYTKDQVCKKSDIYSLGVLFLELLLNHDLWFKNNSCGRCHKNVLNYLKQFSKTNPDLAKVIGKCLSENVKERYTCDELYKEIKSFIQ